MQSPITGRRSFQEALFSRDLGWRAPKTFSSFFFYLFQAAATPTPSASRYTWPYFFPLQSLGVCSHLPPHQAPNQAFFCARLCRVPPGPMYELLSIFIYFKIKCFTTTCYPTALFFNSCSILSEGAAPAKKLAQLMRTPLLISDERLRREVEDCISEDRDCSPHMDRVRAGLGAEYEFTLQQKLRARYIRRGCETPPCRRGLCWRTPARSARHNACC